MSEKGTEAGTPQKKLKARQQGDRVHSRELLSAVGLLAGVLMIGTLTSTFVRDWRTVFEQSLSEARRPESDVETQWSAVIRRVVAPAAVPVCVIVAASFAAALSVGIAQGGGFSIHPDALGFKLNKLNPSTNLANIFSMRSGTRVLKSLVPAAVMVLFGWRAVNTLLLTLPVMSMLQLPNAFNASYGLALDAAWVTLIWSGLDYAVEWIAWNKRMRMTKQEIKDEMKQATGNPQIKGKIRQIQNAMRRRRVKADISKASVVITNPTHYAVALEFSFDTMSAPSVLAKGRNLHALEIREEARWAGVPIIENPPLARSLYRAVEPGQSIPFELYATVAGILAFLYRREVEEKIKAQKRASQQQAEAEARKTPFSDRSAKREIAFDQGES